MVKMLKENTIGDLFNSLLDNKIDKKIMNLIIDNKSSEEIIEKIVNEMSKK